MSVTWGTSALFFLALFRACAQQSDAPPPAQDSTNAMCVERLQLPSFPPLARMARLAGTLSVTVRLGPDSTVDQVSAESHLNNDNAKGVLLAPIETALRKAQFRRDCAGKALVLEFEFRVEGLPSEIPTLEISFGYPNRFWITTRPPIPMVNAP